MRTYIVYIGGVEKFRGTIPDCCKWIEKEQCYSNCFNINLTILLPIDVKYSNLSDEYKKRLHDKLTLGERHCLNSEIRANIIQ